MSYRASDTVQEEEPTTNSSPDEHQNTENNTAEYSVTTVLPVIVLLPVPVPLRDTVTFTVHPVQA